MKAEISTDGQLIISSQGRYEKLALESWYDKFRSSVISECYRMPTLDSNGVPMLKVILIDENSYSEVSE